MCLYSVIGDSFTATMPLKWPQYIQPAEGQGLIPPASWHINFDQITRPEFDALKAEVEAMKQVLIAAKLYDEVSGHKDCETENKIALIKKLAVS